MVLSSVLNVDTLDHCSTRTQNQKKEKFSNSYWYYQRPPKMTPGVTSRDLSNLERENDRLFCLKAVFLEDSPL